MFVRISFSIHRLDHGGKFLFIFFIILKKRNLGRAKAARLGPVTEPVTTLLFSILPSLPRVIYINGNEPDFDFDSSSSRTQGFGADRESQRQIMVIIRSTSCSWNFCYFSIRIVERFVTRSDHRWSCVKLDLIFMHFEQEFDSGIPLFWGLRIGICYLCWFRKILLGGPFGVYKV